MRHSLHHVHLFASDVASLPEGLRSYFEWDEAAGMSAGAQARTRRPVLVWRFPLTAGRSTPGANDPEAGP